MNTRPARPGTTRASQATVRGARGARTGRNYPTSGSVALAPIHRQVADVELDGAPGTGGLDTDGFDIDSFDIDGFDIDGFDADGFDIDGFDADGLDIHGFDIHGFDIHGFDIHGIDIHGIETDGVAARPHAADRVAAGGGDSAYSRARPSRTRSAAERAAADERAAQRVADRAAGRASIESRRRLRIAPPVPVNVARAPFVAFLIFIVIAGVVGILVLNTMINANQFRLNHLQTQQASLDQQQQQLQQTLANQESPGSLVAAARKLGLVPAGALAYIQMPDGTQVGLPGPASGTPSASTGH